jgi:hypothetical protein
MSFLSLAFLSILASRTSARSLRVFDQSTNTPDASAWKTFMPTIFNDPVIFHRYREVYSIGGGVVSGIRIPDEAPDFKITLARSAVDAAPAAAEARTVKLEFTFSFDAATSRPAHRGYHFNVVLGGDSDLTEMGEPEGLGVVINGGASKLQDSFDEFTYEQPTAIVHRHIDDTFCRIASASACTLLVSAATPELTTGVVYRAQLDYEADPLDKTLALKRLHVVNDETGAVSMSVSGTALGGTPRVAAAGWSDGTSQPSIYFMTEQNRLIVGNVTVDYIDADKTSQTTTSTTTTTTTTAAAGTTTPQQTSSTPTTTTTTAAAGTTTPQQTSSTPTSSSSSAPPPTTSSGEQTSSDEVQTLPELESDEPRESTLATISTDISPVINISLDDGPSTATILSILGVAAVFAGLVAWCAFLVVQKRNKEERSSERSLAPDQAGEFCGNTPAVYVAGKGLVRQSSSADSAYSALPSPASLESAMGIYGAGLKPTAPAAAPIYDNSMPMNPRTGYVDVDLSDVSTSGEELSGPSLHYDAPGSAFT